MLSKGTRCLQPSYRWIAAVVLLALAALGWTWSHSPKQLTPTQTSNNSKAKVARVAARQAVTPDEQARLLTSFGNFPLAFEPNQGQTDPQVKYLSRNSHYTLFLTSNEAVFTLPIAPKDEPAGRIRAARKPRPRSQSVLRLAMLGANPTPQVYAGSQIPGHSSYLIGNDPSQWVRDVDQFARVNYRGVYPGVDMTFYGQQRQLEFDFMVQPGADPRKIALGVEGAASVRTDRQTGDVVLTSAAGDLRLHKPVAYQKQGDTRQPVEARFVVKNNEIAFALGPYDHSRELVIDPTILYSTYIGAGAEDDGYAIAVDSTGAAYITGETNSPSFPGAPKSGGGLTPGGLNQGVAGNTKSDAFVVKISADGTTLIYSAFIGGTGTDSGNAIVLDGSKQAYIAGTTDSNDFPIAGNSAQVANGGGNSDAFVAELNANGTALIYSSYIGGTGDEVGYGVAQDSAGIYVVGSTTTSDGSFPISNSGALQASYQGGASDGFVTKIDPATGFLNSVFLGGSGADIATGVAVDGSHDVFVTGVTVSTDFPVHGTASYPNAQHCGTDQNCNSGKDDSFVSEIKADFSQFIYSNYLGGSSFDDANQIVLDSSGNAYVVGITSSSDFPTHNPFQPSLGSGTGVSNAYVTKLDATGNLVFSTYLGGGGTDNALNVALDGSKNVYLTGSTTSNNFPLATATQSSLGGNKDAFVTELKADGSGLLFSTYLGGHAEENHFLAGIAVDGSNNIYVTGDTLSSDFPITGNAPKTSYGPNQCGTANPCRDVFVVKYGPQSAPVSISIGAISPNPISRGSTGTATVTVTPMGAAGTVNLVCNIISSAATPPTCSLNPTSGPLTSNVTSTLTITTVKTGAASILTSALWLPLPGLALLGVGLLSDKNRKRKVILSIAACLALASLLLMAGCGSGNGGGGGGGGGGGTTTGSYTVTVTGTVTGSGSATSSANFSVQ
ncbi:MAG TPA: SBBP repeat-containing protein [Terriglobales bacterium]|nr:SBBP repeat-containing protein [Terriglobales bacterium]